MAKTNCHERATKGVLDMEYLERRLDAIEARIDDLCGLLGEVLERFGRGEISTEDPQEGVPSTYPTFEGPTAKYFPHGR